MRTQIVVTVRHRSSVFISPQYSFLSRQISSALAALTIVCPCLFAVPSYAKLALSRSDATATSDQDQSKYANVCSKNGMMRIDVADPFKEKICKPSGKTLLSKGSDTTLAKISDCVAMGWEAVLVEDDGVLCAMPHLGEKYLDQALNADSPDKRYKKFFMIPKSVCPPPGGWSDDKRLLPPKIVKDLVREVRGNIDPRGIRLIGGKFLRASI